MWLSARLLVAGSITVGCCVFAVNHATDVSACKSLTSCAQCESSSDICGWCQSAGLQNFRCVPLASEGKASLQCSPCDGPRRLARQADRCDQSKCMGAKDEVCSGHGACECDSCVCDEDYVGDVCQYCPVCLVNVCQPLADCALCVQHQGNATLCDSCPRDTQLVSADPSVPNSSVCEFDSVSMAAGTHCSYLVYVWRDEAGEPHMRIRQLCSKNTTAATTTAATTTAATTTAAATTVDVTTARAPTSSAAATFAVTGTTAESAAVPPETSGAVSMTPGRVVACAVFLWTVEELSVWWWK